MLHSKGAVIKYFEEFIGEEMGRLSLFAVATLVLTPGCTAEASSRATRLVPRAELPHKGCRTVSSL